MILPDDIVVSISRCYYCKKAFVYGIRNEPSRQSIDHYGLGECRDGTWAHVECHEKQDH